MKGAIAELCAMTIRTARMKRPTNMGANHHLLALQKNENNSPTVLKRLAAVLAAFKRAAIIEGTYARACAGLVPLEIGQRLHGNAVALIGRAAGWAAGGDI